MKTLYVDKIIPDTKINKLKNTFIKPSQIKTFIDEDVDVYTKSGKLLLRFRKKQIAKEISDKFFDATYKFTVKNTSKNRGNTSGSEFKDINKNEPIASSILGYFDKWAPNQKCYFRNANVKLPLEVRETMFSNMYPEKMKNAELLIKKINTLYKELVPKYYKIQHKKANETQFKIANTAFTTITTNVNFKTSVHKDKGDDEEGFGNLTVIERGRYTGGETCFPQYGIAVNVREGDILFMDVHEWHGNLPFKLETKDSVRMSVVCYLRTNIWKRTKGKSKNFRDRHLKSIKKTMKRGCYSKKTKKRRK